MVLTCTVSCFVVAGYNDDQSPELVHVSVVVCHAHLLIVSNRKECLRSVVS